MTRSVLLVSAFPSQMLPAVAVVVLPRVVVVQLPLVAVVQRRRRTLECVGLALELAIVLAFALAFSCHGWDCKAPPRQGTCR